MLIACGNPDCKRSTEWNLKDLFLFCPMCGHRYAEHGVDPITLRTNGRAFAQIEKSALNKMAFACFGTFFLGIVADIVIHRGPIKSTLMITGALLLVGYAMLTMVRLAKIYRMLHQ